MKLPAIKTSCKPRQEILQKELATEAFAANLEAVVRKSAPDMYKDAAAFFSNTYPTQGLKDVVGQVFGRLSTGDPQYNAVIQLETGLGGGKTHTLIALYHLAQHGKLAGAKALAGNLRIPECRAIALVGNEIPTQGPTFTLWGALAAQIGGDAVKAMAKHDKERTPPEKTLLASLFTPKEKYLLLLDEVALHLENGVGIPVGGSTLARQTITFLQTLTELAGELRNVVVVITQLDAATGVYRESSEELSTVLKKTREAAREDAVRDGQQVLSRVVHHVVPANPEDFGSIIRHRLFETVDDNAADAVANAYFRSLRDKSVAPSVPAHVKEAPYLDSLIKNYPFHPELINVLRQKLSTNPNFQRTRGVLRLLCKVVRDAWAKHPDAVMLHTWHVDLSQAMFREEVLNRLGYNHLQGAIDSDIYNEEGGARAAKVDATLPAPWGTRAAITVFLHSLVSSSAEGVRKGESEPYIQAALHEPGLDPKLVENALRGLVSVGYHFHESAGLYYFSEHPSLNKVVETEKERVETTQVWQELRSRIQNYYGGKVAFEPCFFKNDPGEIPDNMENIKLVIPDFNEVSWKKGQRGPPDLIQKIFREHSRGEHRTYRNNVVFLVADNEEITQMQSVCTEYLALNRLVDRVDKNELTDLGQRQESLLKSRYKEFELYVRTAVVNAYKHLYVPAAQTGLGDEGKLPLKHLDYKWSESDIQERHTKRQSEQEALRRTLIKLDVAMDPEKEPMSPEYVLAKLWRDQENYPVKSTNEFRKMFFMDPSAKLQFGLGLITKCIELGLKQGTWHAKVGGTLYHSRGDGVLSVLYNDETKVILAQSKIGRDELRLATQPVATPSSIQVGRPSMEPLIAVPKSRLVEYPQRAMLEKVAAELGGLIQTRGFSHLSEVEFRFTKRDGLVKMLRAAPQFVGATLKFHVSLIHEGGPSGSNEFKAEYRGDLKGLNSLKAVWESYEQQNQEVLVEGSVVVSYPDGGIASKEFLELLGNRVANFTGTSTYTAKVVCKEA